MIAALKHPHGALLTALRGRYKGGAVRAAWPPILPVELARVGLVDRARLFSRLFDKDVAEGLLRVRFTEFVYVYGCAVIGQCAVILCNHKPCDDPVGQHLFSDLFHQGQIAVGEGALRARPIQRFAARRFGKAINHLLRSIFFLSCGVAAHFPSMEVCMPDLNDPMSIYKRSTVGGAWSELWDAHGGVLLHMDCSLGDIVRSGAAAGVLFLECVGSWARADQAAFVRAAGARDVSVFSLDIYLNAVSDPDGVSPQACKTVSRWRDVVDRRFSGLVIGPNSDALMDEAVLRHARQCLRGNRAVFILSPRWNASANPVHPAADVMVA